MTKVVKLAVAGAVTVGAMVLACVPTKEIKRKQKKNTLADTVQDFVEAVEDGTAVAKNVAEDAIKTVKEAAEDVAEINSEKSEKDKKEAK